MTHSSASMRFAHFSDCHLGSWNNHPELRELSTRTFETSIDRCISEGVDFILIAGDLFDTALPPLDILRRAVIKFRHCRDAGIPVYAIPGSHDFSPTGKTFLAVLEDAGLLVDVAKSSEVNGKIKLHFVKDKTGAKITGVAGKMGALEHTSFELLDRGIEQEDGFKIFLFHSAIEEYKPPHLKEMRALPLSLLPKNFGYYAAGHVHMRHESSYSGSKIIFPGPMFPTEFTELENFCAGFYIVDTVNGAINAVPQDVHLCGTALIGIDATSKTPQQISAELLKIVGELNLENKILLVKLGGVMEGSTTDIDFQAVIAMALAKGAIAVKKNASKLSSKQFEEIEIKEAVAIEELEREIIREHSGKIKFPYKNEEKTTFSLMDILNDEKQEGETVSTFEERLKQNAKKTLGL